MRLAAIDIGSNAARLLIAEIIEKEDGTVETNKLNLIRVPFRLGMDVFNKGKIGKQREKMLVETLQAFGHLMSAYSVDKYRACATSAMRDAKNSKEILQAVKRTSKLDIEIISGDEEASLVFETHITDKLDASKSYLYIDVGGGSTELSLFSDGRHIYRKSFNIGTIRLLSGLEKEKDWDNMEREIKEQVNDKEHELIGIGSGGNINKVFSLTKKKDGKMISVSTLKSYLKDMEKMTVGERMKEYNFKEDRADVIVPALEIYTKVARWAGIHEMYVPKIGVADGLIHQLYETERRK